MTAPISASNPLDPERVADALSPEVLLPALRRLARSLVNGDPQLADDLVQDAWLVTLQHQGPAPGRGLLRSLLHRRRRAEARRRRHEAQAATGDADVVKETTHLRELTDHVLALDEPYRTTVLLRFLEELPPREIARRMGCPVPTVNSRLTRGLARLRERLGSDQEGRERWAQALLPYLGQRDGALLSIGVLMTTKTVVGLAAGAALAAFLGWRVLGGPQVGEPAPSVLEVAAAGHRATELASDPESPVGEPGPADAELRSEVEVPAAGMDREVAPERVETTTPAQATSASLSGKLLIPQAWEFTEFMLLAHDGEEDGGGGWKRGELLHDPAASPEDTFEFPFEFEELPVGVLVLLLDRTHTFERITLPEEGLHDLVIEVPMPATATVDVVDGLTGAAVSGGELGWSLEMPPEVTHYSNNGVERDGAEPVTLQVASGQANFFLHHPDFWSEESTHEIRPGANLVRIEVMPAAGVVLAFFDGFGEPTRHPRIEWSAFQGPGSIIGMGAVDGESHKIRITLSEPGTYRVALSAQPLVGIQDPEPFEITVFQGELLEHEIRLVGD